MFLIIINTLHTDDLDVLREHNTTRDISIISCCALLAKFVFMYFIHFLPDEPLEEHVKDKNGDEEQRAEFVIDGILDAL